MHLVPGVLMGLSQIARVFPVLFFLLAWSVARAGEITVSAASSLSDAFSEMARSYGEVYPDDEVWLNTGASGALLQQMENGAPVEVFASADEDTMTSAVGMKLVREGAARPFAGNRLVIVTAKDFAGAPATAGDLRSDLVRRVAMGNPVTVPAGRYGRDVLTSMSLWGDLEPKFTFTENVRQALAYVARGEVDVGVVYATDARGAADRVKVTGRLPVQRPIRYVIAPVAGCRNAAGAERFVDFVLSPAGQGILEKYGFLPAE